MNEWPGTPSDLARRARKLYRDLGVNIVSGVDDNGSPIELTVPYDLGQGDVLGFRVRRRGPNIEVRRFGTRTRRCAVEHALHRELLAFFRELDGTTAGPAMPRRGSHQLRICT